MVRARASTAETCLFLPDVLIQCFSQSCMDDHAEDFAGYGEQSDASPVVAVTLSHPDNESGLPCLRNRLALPYISEYAHQKARCFSFFSLEHFCCHSICSICLPALQHFDRSFHLFHGRWISTDIQVLYCRWNLSYLFRFWPI